MISYGCLAWVDGWVVRVGRKISGGLDEEIKEGGKRGEEGTKESREERTKEGT